MGSLEKLSEAIELTEEKKNAVHSLMGLVMLEWKDVEGHLRVVKNFQSECFSELELKDNHLKAVQESVRQKGEEFDLKRRLVEEGLKKLDEKEKLLRGVLQEVEVGMMKFGKMRDSVDEKLKEVVLKEQHFQGLFGELSLIQSQVEKIENELDSKGKILGKREEEIVSKEEKLVIRESEIDLKEKTLNIKKNEVESKERILERRESLMDLEKIKLETRENEFDMEETRLNDLVKELEMREGILDLKLKLISMKKNSELCIEEPDSLKSIRTAEPKGEGRKRCKSSTLMSIGTCEAPRGEWRKRCKSSSLMSIGTCDADKEGMNTSSSQAKRSCIHEEDSGQIKALCIGSPDKPQAASTQYILVLDDSEPDLDSRDNLNSNPISDPSSFPRSIQEDKLGRQFNVGEIWSCFDAKDNIPRSYVEIIKVLNEGRNVRLGVSWLKPCCPTCPGDKEWIDAGLPVACGMFEPVRTSVESPSIFYQICCADKSKYPFIILPHKGETWAIYKDWDIIRWSSYPEIHRQCKYEIVEILSYSYNGSSFLGIRVAYLNKIVGFANSFRRRSQNGKDSFLIKPNSLYRFSHKVLSIQKTCHEKNGITDGIFELDLKSLPPGL